MGTKHFGDDTSWGIWDRTDGSEGWSEPGWAIPSDHSRYISKHDPYWGQVLDRARHAYGDPNIHYSTDNVGAERHLVFGDGTRLPVDGTIVYHDAGTKQNWAQNDDGSVSLVGPDGKQDLPISAAGYRKLGDHYAPVNADGRQIGPQLGGVPSSDNGFYTDPKTGLLTPKNSNGDYYTLGPDGTKAFFDKHGAPISAEQFTNADKPRDPAQPRDGGLITAEQQSGKAADAVKKLQHELRNHYTQISDAEDKLSEVLLNAHATTTAGQQRLNDIQKTIVDAVNDPTMAMDTPAGERAFLTLLRNQVGAINELIAAGGLSAQDQSKAAQALAVLYATDSGAVNAVAPNPADPNPTQAAPAAPADLDPAPTVTGPGVGAPADMVDPRLAEPGLSDVAGGDPLGSDALSSLGSVLPALGALGGAGASPLDSLGGLAGAASPLAGLTGLTSGLGDQGNHERPPDTTDKADSPDHAKDAKAGKAESTKADTTSPADGAPGAPGQHEQNAGNATPGDPPGAGTSPVAASATVQLPDGSTSTARSPQTAQAIRDYLAGKTVDAAYRQNNIALPPPGTPVTNPLDPSRLACGDLAMFKDHYVPVLSSVKAFVNGQVVSLGSVSSSPDFLGWIDPTAGAASTAVHGAPPPAPQSAIPPVAGSAPGVSAPQLAAAAPVPAPAGG